ncbi:unnamed protein product, partial [Prorocentrum cordatum]
EEIAHFSWKVGMMLRSRYQVIRNVEKYTKNAKREAEILKDIRAAMTEKASGCVVMHETFVHTEGEERFFCMSFEVLGGSLYDFLKKNRFRGFWVQDIQDIARQCLQALSFLHDDLNLTHTDLKLENVLFQSEEPPRPSTFPREAAWRDSRAKRRDAPVAPYVRPASTKIKLIDFGNATYELEHHSTIINTRQYRAPEVILALGWDERSDLWSTGCILMELYTGELLFRTHESLEHLALMERAIETFPGQMLSLAATTARQEQFLVMDPPGSGRWRLHWPELAKSPASDTHVKSQRKMSQLVESQHSSLADFSASLLILEPSRRPSAKAALAHPFLFDSFDD